MGRKIKVDNAILKRQKYKKGKKDKAKKKIEEYILIVCEGEKTEPNYFEAIKKTFSKKTLQTHDISIEGTGTNTLRIVEIAIQLRQDAKELNNRIYDQVWAVFDRDSFPVANFNNAIFKGEGKNIECAWSNEAFELWYILHFQYRNTAMSREDYKACIEKELSDKMSLKAGKKVNFKYKKNSIKMYEQLQEYGDEEQAIKWSKRLDDNFQDTNFSSHNPCTKVYKLIKKLNNIRKK